MKTQPMRQLLLIAGLAGVLMACAPAQTPAATSAPTEVAAPTEEVAPTEVAAPTEEAAPTEVPAPAEGITATTEMTAETTETTTEPLPIESVGSAQCDALQVALSEKLGHELTKQEGTACTLVATGTGEDFGNFVDVSKSIADVFTTEGWTEDQSAAADGPTSTSRNYVKDTTVATASVGWAPSDDVECPADQPISACDIEPSQQDFIITVTLVQIA